VELVSQKKLPQPTSLIASPAKRAHQTLEPLAKTLGLNVQTQLLFNQRLRAESAKDFHQRVLRALRWLEEYPHEQGSPKTVIFICSHIDWLDEAYGSLTSTEPLPFLGLWRPGEYLVFDMEKGLWKTIEQGVL
jgi:broad specificity phosphatase PhoE